MLFESFAKLRLCNAQVDEQMGDAIAIRQDAQQDEQAQDRQREADDDEDQGDDAVNGPELAQSRLDDRLEEVRQFLGLPIPLRGGMDRRRQGPRPDIVRRARYAA